MKHIHLPVSVLGFAVGFLGFSCQSAQSKVQELHAAGIEAATSTVQTQRAIELYVEELYRAFCFDPNQEPDWEAMRALFHPNACFASPIRRGHPVKVQGIAGFVNDFQQWIRTSDVGTTGLHERVIKTRTEFFANIAHVFVTFEGFVPGETEAQTLGVDSLQLVLEEDNWKLVSFTSQYVSGAEPLPGQFAPAPFAPGR